MAKNIELYEEDDFFLEEQNSNEEQIVEEDENEEEAVVNLRPRPARASLTHNAIKSEILKMNKQNRNDSNEDADQNLSRSARKRKKRREKVLEERRASGGRSFEDDLDHFKSIPISRRRSSVLPLQTISLPNHNNCNDGFCSKFKFCFWILLIIGTLIGLFFWPTVAELELTEESNKMQESNENQIDHEHSINEIDQANDQGEKIINNINKLSDELGDLNEVENQIEDERNDEEEEGLSTFSYISSFFATEEQADIVTAADHPNEDEQNNEQESNQQNDSNDNEQVIEPATTADNQEDGDEFNDQVDKEFDDQVDEGFEQTATIQSNEEQINELENENLENTMPERYRSAVHQEDNLGDENLIDSCVIAGVNYNNLNEEQCSLLQERHRHLEQLREQEQLIRQEQQVDNNEEPFYFF